MYTVNVRTQLVYSFTSLALADYITNVNGAGFSTTTSLALCLANSLIQCDNRHPPSLGIALGLGREEPDGGLFSVRHQAAEYIRWWRAGHLSVSPAAAPSAPDGAMQAALQIWEAGLKSGRPTAEILDAVRSGQLLGQTSPPPPASVVVWVLPVALLFWRDTARAVELARAAADAVVPAARDLAGWYVFAVTSVLWNWAARSDVRLDKPRIRTRIEDEYQRLGLGGEGGVAGGLGAEDVHRGVEIYMQTDTFGEGLSVARRCSSSSSPQVVMAYAGIAAAWYGAAAIGWKVDARAFAGYGVVERVAGAIGTLAKVMEKRDDDCMQMLASSIPLDDECEGML
ncbi:hypothetical protein DFP73DRAFT_537586 [Morchella snyderi]|nr:hypothetical protein DFP73DRAFT_537586 [Morchella snyderi]